MVKASVLVGFQVNRFIRGKGIALTLSAFALSLCVLPAQSSAETTRKPRQRVASNRQTTKSSHLQTEILSADRAPREKEATRTTTAAWRLGIHGQSFATEERREQAQSVGLGLDGRLQMKLMPMLDINAEAGVALESAQVETRFGDQVPRNGMNLTEALVNLRPFAGFSISGGAINQAHLQSPLLVSERPFPGAIERYKYDNEVFGFELKAQQTIPTSVTLSTRVEDGEKTPTFMSEGVIIKTRPVREFELSANASTFRFSQLPATVAFESEVQGNTVIESGPSTSRFLYDYAGWTAGGAGRLYVSKSFEVAAGAQMLQNTKADPGFRNGQLAFAEMMIQIPHEIRIKPRGEIFFNESDSSPAFYNSSDLGHNNRQGFAVELNVEFPRERFNVGARFADADVLEASVHQGRQQYILLKLETFYEFF